jgi:AcrR family transcriptional regulator
MDILVARCEYSKGTVYKHFSCKEDLLCAIEKFKVLYRLFQKVAANTHEGCAQARSFGPFQKRAKPFIL